jgi:hypothetical protein
MMRVKALMLLPPGICWISFMLEYLPAAAAAAPAQQQQRQQQDKHVVLNQCKHSEEGQTT